ncbi:hypothetical protein C8Q77DRAFT_233104 [Trametes polyzona]|nr:hypothetical protein C8Q77DRAFT_233104 [Trametes polyzona]
MYFSKSIIAAFAVFLGLTAQAHAHAGVQPALGVSGALTRADVQRPSSATPCGDVDVTRNIDKSAAVTVKADNTFTVTVTNFNPGTDGSRQVSAMVDFSGTGEKFVAATVVQNGDKAPKNVGSQEVIVQLPEGSRCTGGTSGDLCLVAFTTTSGFGNCVVVQTPATAASTVEPSATSTPAPPLVARMQAPAKQPAKQPARIPEQQPAKQPVGQPAKVPAQASAKAPAAPGPAKAPVREPPKAPAKTSVKVPAKAPAKGKKIRSGDAMGSRAARFLRLSETKEESTVGVHQDDD